MKKAGMKPKLNEPVIMRVEKAGVVKNGGLDVELMARRND